MNAKQKDMKDLFSRLNISRDCEAGHDLAQFVKSLDMWTRSSTDHVRMAHWAMAQGDGSGLAQLAYNYMYADVVQIHHVTTAVVTLATGQETWWLTWQE